MECLGDLISSTLKVFQSLILQLVYIMELVAVVLVYVFERFAACFLVDRAYSVYLIRALPSLLIDVPLLYIFVLDVAKCELCKVFVLRNHYFGLLRLFGDLAADGTL